MSYESKLLKEVKAALLPLADHKRALDQQAYMKDIAPFLGISAPDRRAATKPVFKAHPPANFTELAKAAKVLYAQEFREYAFAANDLLAQYIDLADRNFLATTVADLIRTNPWWDTVDGLGAAVTPLAWKYPSRTLMRTWIKDPSIWINRAAIGHQRGRRSETEVDFILWLCHQKAGESEFFIAKAIGWALRDIAAFDKPAVRAFLADHPSLNRVAVREAERGLNR
ncbi:MAG: DNA alkylation repair protein [Actinomycetes bacterium]